MKIPFTNINLNFSKSNTVNVDKALYDSLMNANTGQNAGFNTNTRPKMYDREFIYDGEVAIPIQPLPMDVLYEIANYSDILRVVYQHLRKAIFRYGVEIQENFSKKCNNPECGKEYNNSVDVCTECGGTDFIEPDIKQKIKLLNFTENANENGQDIVEVTKQINDDLEIADNGYLLCIKEYFYANTGKLLGSKPLEVIRADPRYIRKVTDKTGRPARNESGDYVMFCPEHRSEKLLNQEKCPQCGRETLLAHFRTELTEGKFIYYAEGEIKWAAKYNPKMIYGLSVMYSYWMKVITLMNMDKYIKDYYGRQRPPRGLLMISTSNVDSVEKSWNWLIDKWRQNPHQIPPFAIENEQGKGDFVKFIDFMRPLEEMQYKESRDEMRRTILACHGIMPIFSGDIESSGGMNNEGNQLTVNQQAINDGQKLHNEEYFRWLTKQLGVTHYKLVLVENADQSESRDVELMQKKIQNAKIMQEMGFSVIYTEEGNFEFDPIDEPVEAKEQPTDSGFPQEAKDNLRNAFGEDNPENPDNNQNAK